MVTGKDMSERASAANRRSGRMLRWTLPVIAAAALIWALVSAFFSVDIAEFGVVMRFGRVVRVVAEPGLHVTAPFDRVVRLDKRLLFSRPARSEYLTTDKKNVVVESLAVWRIADAERFLTTLATRDAAENRLSDIVLAEMGSVMGRYPASVLISTDPAQSRYRRIVSEVGRRVADFAGPAYGVDVVSVDIRHVSLPDVNREHVFDRMKAERAKIAKENRSAGELEAKKIIAEADHEKTRIDADAAGRAEHIKAEADAEASRVYATAFGEDPRFYKFLRTLRAYDKFLDDKTTVFLPADAEVLRMLRFDKLAPAEPATAPAGDRAGLPTSSGSSSAGTDLLLQRKPEERAR